MTAPRPDGPLRHLGSVRSLRRRRSAGVVGLVVAGLALSACVNEVELTNPPGANVGVNGIKVRYAHFEDPDTPGTGYVPGDDVPLYLWLENEASDEVELVDVSAAITSDVTLDGAEMPVELPIGTLVEMGPDDPHFVLEDITSQLRGAEMIPVTLSFSNGAEIEILVEAIEVDAID